MRNPFCEGMDLRLLMRFGHRHVHIQCICKSPLYNFSMYHLPYTFLLRQKLRTSVGDSHGNTYMDNTYYLVHKEYKWLKSIDDTTKNASTCGAAPTQHTLEIESPLVLERDATATEGTVAGMLSERLRASQNKNAPTCGTPFSRRTSSRVLKYDATATDGTSDGKLSARLRASPLRTWFQRELASRQDALKNESVPASGKNGQHADGTA